MRDYGNPRMGIVNNPVLYRFERLGGHDRKFFLIENTEFPQVLHVRCCVKSVSLYTSSKMFSLFSLSLLVTVALCQTKYPAPQSCSGACGVHDPSVIKRSDGTYFRFGTGGGIKAATAKSLNGPWTAISDVLPGGSSINNPGKTDIWVSR